jgi:CRP-like cAMP-binding protein
MMDKESIVKFIQKNATFSEIIINEIVKNFEIKNIPKNDFILSAGKICNEYLFLEEGYMRAYIYDYNGCDVTTNFYYKNQPVFDASSFFFRSASKENIQALTDCKGWVLNYDTMDKLFHSIPEFREFGRSMLVKEFVSLKERMVSALTETAEERYLTLIQNNPDIFQYSTLKNIASYLGVTDTSFSRIRKNAFKTG